MEKIKKHWLKIIIIILIIIALMFCIIKINDNSSILDEPPEKIIDNDKEQGESSEELTTEINKIFNDLKNIETYAYNLNNKLYYYNNKTNTIVKFDEKGIYNIYENEKSLFDDLEKKLEVFTNITKNNNTFVFKNDKEEIQILVENNLIKEIHIKKYKENNEYEEYQYNLLFYNDNISDKEKKKNIQIINNLTTNINNEEIFINSLSQNIDVNGSSHNITFKYTYYKYYEAIPPHILMEMYYDNNLLGSRIIFDINFEQLNKTNYINKIKGIDNKDYLTFYDYKLYPSGEEEKLIIFNEQGKVLTTLYNINGNTGFDSRNENGCYIIGYDCSNQVLTKVYSNYITYFNYDCTSENFDTVNEYKLTINNDKINIEKLNTFNNIQISGGSNC